MLTFLTIGAAVIAVILTGVVGTLMLLDWVIGPNDEMGSL